MTGTGSSLSADCVNRWRACGRCCLAVPTTATSRGDGFRRRRVARMCARAAVANGTHRRGVRYRTGAMSQLSRHNARPPRGEVLPFLPVPQNSRPSGAGKPAVVSGHSLRGA
jgi:hypothetical protein